MTQQLPPQRHMLTIPDWFSEAIHRSAVHAGTPEGRAALAEANRYAALGTTISALDEQLTRVTAERDALAAKLAEVEQAEPVAWIEHELSGTGLRHLHFERREPNTRDDVVAPKWTALYLSPAAPTAPAKREPLTQSQRLQVFKAADARLQADENLSWREAIVLETERAHGISTSKTAVCDSVQVEAKQQTTAAELPGGWCYTMQRPKPLCGCPDCGPKGGEA